jgi:hypothetical protein
VLAPNTQPNKPCQHKGAEPSSTQAFGIGTHTGLDVCLHRRCNPEARPRAHSPAHTHSHSVTHTHKDTHTHTHRHTHTHTHSQALPQLTHSLTHSFTHPLMHALTYSQKHRRRAHSFMHVPSHSYVHRPRKAACRTNARLWLRVLSGTRPLCHPQSSAPQRAESSRLPLSPPSK